MKPMATQARDDGLSESGRSSANGDSDETRLERVAWTCAAWAFGLGLWQAVAFSVTAMRGIPFPTPIECLRSLADLLGGTVFLEHTIYHHLLVSLARWAEGFGIGFGAGLAYALIAGWWRGARLITMPTVEVLQVIPGLAWIPIAILLFGLNHTATVAMIAVTTFPAVAISGVMGVRSVDSRYVRAARMCGAGSAALFATVLLPGAASHLLSGLRISVGASWRVLVAAEMIVGSGDGLGYAIIQSRWTMDYVSSFVCIGLIASLGLALERLVLTPLEGCTVRRWGLSHDH